MRMSGTLLAFLAVLAPAAPAAAATSGAATDGPAYFWQWTDGSEARSRTFAEHAYDLPSRLPRLVVRTHPATTGRHVVLQTRVRGHWRTEDSGATDRHGTVRLALNPYCANGDWCRSAFDYRLVVDGQTAAIRITYVD
jgi:hypothetical protein